MVLARARAFAILRMVESFTNSGLLKWTSAFIINRDDKFLILSPDVETYKGKT